MSDQPYLQRINAFLEAPFPDLGACLEHYRENLPRRVGDYHQEEVGPIYHHDLPGEAERFVAKEFHLGEATLDMSDGLFSVGFGEEVPGRDEKLFRERGLSTLMENRVPDTVHRRQVFFAKPHGWVVRDTIEGSAVTHADQLWHFFEGPLRQINDDGTAWATDFADANLILLSRGEPAVYEGRREPFIAGWHCPYYDQLRPAPELRFTRKGRNRITFHTLILPVEGSVTSVPEFEVAESHYRIRHGNIRFRIHAPADGDWSMD